jgi:hypothetical protein
MRDGAQPAGEAALLYRYMHSRCSQGSAQQAGMVLNLLVSIFRLQGEQQYKAHHCIAPHRAGRARRA